MTAKKKILWITIPLLAVLAAVAGYFCFRGPSGPPLPPEEQVKHDFQKAFDPTESTLARLDSLRGSFKSIRGLPAERRQMLIIEATAEAIDRILLDFAALPSDQKPERARLIREDAERTCRYFRKMPVEKQRKAVALLMNSEAGRAKFNQAINTTTNVLSPQDRELLGPTLKIWKDMLENTK